MIALLLALAVGGETDSAKLHRFIMAAAADAAAPQYRTIYPAIKEARTHQAEPFQEPAKEPAKPSTISESLTVELLGPDDYLQGSTPPFVAVVNGEITAIKWRISPAVPGLDIKPGRMTAVFTTPNPGIYRIMVAVSGPSGLDVAEREFEILERPPVEPEQPPAKLSAKPPAKEPAAARPAPPVKAEQPDFVTMLTTWVNDIRTSNRGAEARVIGACFKGTAARIKTKTFPAGTDPIADVQRQVGMGLVPNPGAWQSLFDNLRPEAQQIGSTPEELAPWLLGVGDILASMR